MLGDVERAFDEGAREDPFYTALTQHDLRGGGWSPEEFYATGRDEVARVLRWSDRPAVPRGRALDFGCGPGRLTLALADEFATVVGVDISQTMLDAARAAAGNRMNIEFMHNTRADLRAVRTASVDFIYSSITLQHVHPDAIRSYVTEFVRILTPNGAAVFHIPERMAPRTSGVRRWLYDLRRVHLRRLWKRLRGRIPYEIHGLPSEEVQSLIEAAGGTLQSFRTDGKGGWFYHARVRPREHAARWTP